MKLLIFIEHDIIIRHFVHSRVFNKLIEEHDVKFIFPEPGHKRVKSEISNLDLGAKFEHLIVHKKRIALWSRLFVTDCLRWRRGVEFKILRKLRRQVIGLKASFLFGFFALPGIFFILKQWTLFRMKLHRNHDLEYLFNKEKPDVIIHPSILEGVYINELVAISNERNIPLVVIMNSWDNPSTKKSVLGCPDWLLVWGDQTKSHAIKFMGMPKEKVIKFGAAQFDLYKKPPRISRDEFCKTHNINTFAKILLYAGSSKGTNEFNHLIKIDNAISKGEIGNVVVVYRPHPWGRAGKDGEYIIDYQWKNIYIEESMRKYLERVRDGNAEDINLADYRYTHDLLSSIDVLVSPLSTILIEGALHSKPVLCFMPNEEVDAWHFTIATPLIHFQDFYQKPEFLMANGNEQLIPKINELLKLSENVKYSENLQNACRFFVSDFDKSYSQRLKEFIENTAYANR